MNGPHQFSARATDTSGNVSSLSTAAVRFLNVPGAYAQRIAGGNPSNVVDCSSLTWVRDTNYSFGSFGYSGGTTGYLGNSISGICSSAQSLYQRERYSTSSGGFYYEFDCPVGIYETTLLEAETYWSAAGKRSFNVFIQGAQVLTNFDIYAAAGGQNIPLSRVFTNTVTNSQLQVLFTPVVDNARIWESRCASSPMSIVIPTASRIGGAWPTSATPSAWRRIIPARPMTPMAMAFPTSPSFCWAQTR